MTYVRKLSPLERLHAAVGASPETLEVPRWIAHVVEGEGELEPERWREAVRIAGAANPGARVVLRGHLWRARWCESRGSGPRVRVAANCQWDGLGSDGAEVLDAEVLALRNGPVCEVVLMPGATPRVAFRALHAAMDGRGLLHFALDVFRCLRGEEPIGSDSRLTDTELMSAHQGGDPPFVVRRWLQPTGGPVGGARGNVWRRVDLPGQHPHLLARVALATARHAWLHHGHGPVRFGIPVDLRPLSPGIRSTANLTGMACLDVPRWASVPSLEASLKAQIARGDHAAVPPIIGAASVIPLDRLDRITGRTPDNYRQEQPTMHSGALSNMGRVALDDIQGGGFRGRLVFMTPQLGSLFISLMGCETGAHLAVSVPQIYATGGRLDALCDAIREEIRGGVPTAAVAMPGDVATPSAFERADFGDGFVWGVGTSAYQIEGAVAEDGRQPSVWDVFERPRRHFPSVLPRVRNLDSAAVACDHYHRVDEDLDLIADLGVNAYRFSIAWPRVLPMGDGEVNEAGIRFYDRLIDGILERGLTPYATLYHWDLPQALEERGGWTNRRIVDWFRRFADVCARAFGDRVKHWVVVNEALSFSLLGHLFGVAAPGRRGLGNFLPAVHHSQLAQAAGCRAVKEFDPTARVGTSVALTRPHPHSDRTKDVQAAARLQAFQRIFVDPVLGRGYPVAELPFLQKIDRFVQPGDIDACKFDLDFLGVNHYFRFIVRHNPVVPLFQLSPAGPAPGSVSTALDWEVHAPSLFDLLCELGADPDIPDLIVTENGAAFHDRVDPDGRVRDQQRLAYLQDYVAQVLRARRAGVRVGGYFAWSALDNFEWQSGFEHRFGLYHVDYGTQQRTLKDSGRWYRSLLRGEAQRTAGETVRVTA